MSSPRLTVLSSRHPLAAVPAAQRTDDELVKLAIRLAEDFDHNPERASTPDPLDVENSLLWYQTQAGGAERCTLDRAAFLRKLTGYQCEAVQFGRKLAPCTLGWVSEREEGAAIRRAFRFETNPTVENVGTIVPMRAKVADRVFSLRRLWARLMLSLDHRVELPTGQETRFMVAWLAATTALTAFLLFC